MTTPTATAATSSSSNRSNWWSREVCARLGITPRQLQWWDERNVIPPSRIVGHRREYSPADVLQLAIAAELRRRGVSLAQARRVLRSVRRHQAEIDKMPATEPIWLATDGQTAVIESDCGKLIERVSLSLSPMFVIDLGGIRASLQHFAAQ